MTKQKPFLQCPVACEKEEEISAIHRTLKKLEWLGDEDVKGTLKEIIEEKKAYSILGKKILKWASILIATAGLVWTIIKEMRK